MDILDFAYDVKCKLNAQEYMNKCGNGNGNGIECADTIDYRCYYTVMCERIGCGKGTSKGNEGISNVIKYPFYF